MARAVVGLCPVRGGRLALHVAHLAVDALDAVVVDEQVGDGAELRRLGRQRRLERGSELEEVLGERHRDLDGVGGLPGADGDLGAGELLHGGHGLVHVFTCGDTAAVFKGCYL